MTIECADLKNKKKNFPKCVTAYYASYGSQIVTLCMGGVFLEREMAFFVGFVKIRVSSQFHLCRFSCTVFRWYSQPDDESVRRPECQQDIASYYFTTSTK